MPNLYCQEPGCCGDGIIPVFCCNTTTMTFRKTLRCCPKCNHQDKNLDDIQQHETRLPYGQTEEMVRGLGYRSYEEVESRQVELSKKAA